MVWQGSTKHAMTENKQILKGQNYSLIPDRLHTETRRFFQLNRETSVEKLTDNKNSSTTNPKACSVQKSFLTMKLSHQIYIKTVRDVYFIFVNTNHNPSSRCSRNPIPDEAIETKEFLLVVENSSPIEKC